MSDRWRPKQSHTERIGRAVQSMIPGTMEGRIASAKPTPGPPTPDDSVEEVAEAVFSYPAAPIAGEESPPYVNRVAHADMGTVIASTLSTTTSATTIAIRVNSVQVATVTIPSGAKKTGETLVEDVALDYGDQISVIATTVGNGLSGVVVQILIGD